MYYYSWLIKTLLLPQLVTNLTYFVVGHLLLYLNLNRYKIRKLTILEKEKFPLYKNLIINLTVNSTISLIIGLLFLQISPTHINPDDFIETNYIVMLFKVFMAYVISQIVFFTAHLIFHTKIMYKHFHYLHHQAEDPISLTANYCHPVEFTFSNLPTVVMGVILTQMSWLLSVVIWYPLITIISLLEHSGYKFFFFDPSHHDKHHKLKMYNYSSWPFVDKMFGTYK